MGLYAALTDLLRQVANVLAPEHGGTGSTHGEERVVQRCYNATGGDLPLYTLVELGHYVNAPHVQAVAALDSTAVLGVVVGYYDGQGLLVEADSPDGSEVAVQTSGRCPILIESAVTRGQYAFAAATDGTIYSSATAAAGAFGIVVESADIGNTGTTTALVSFPLTASAGGGGGGTFASPAWTFGTSASAGSASTGVRSDAGVALFDATTPAAIGTAATGSAGKAARRDHVHATGAGTPSTQAFGDAAAVGSGPAASMTDHKHAMPANPTVGLAGGLDIVVLNPATGVVVDIEMPFAGTWTSWRVFNDASGNVQYDLWLKNYAGFPPTIADTITASAKPKTTAAAKAQDSTLTGWTTAFAAGDILRVNIDSTSGLTRSVLSLRYVRT